MPKPIPKRWSFSLTSEEFNSVDLSWPDVLKETARLKSGEVAASSDAASAQLEFNATHAAVLFMQRGGDILRPYFPGRPAEGQDITAFYCDCCGDLLGPRDEYLARFMERAEGFRLFEAMLREVELPRGWAGEGLKGEGEVLE